MSKNVTFSKILVAVDGSSHSMKAVDCAISLAKSQRSDIHAISVYTVSYFGLHAVTDKMFIQNLNKQIKIHEGYLVQVKAKADKNNVRFKPHLIEGGTNTGIEIIKFAEKNGIDLIVMGSRGHTKFKKLLLGSVASTVIAHAPCPVMVVR